MARVGNVEYPAAKIKLPITFTETRGRFACTYAGTTYEHTDINALRAAVLAAIKDANQVTWTPVITLSYSTAPGQYTTTYAYLSLARERIYIGYLPTAGYKQVHWTATEEKRLEVSKTLSHWEKDKTLTLPAHHASFDGKAYIYLAYSEELWNALEEIQQYIQIATKKLTTHLQTEAGIALLLERCRGLYDHTRTAQDENEGGGEEEL
jgi:hypothetical protein